MGTIIVFILVGIFFLWLLVYSSVMPKIMRKQGRQVDARVVSCEAAALSVPGSEQNAVYYSVTVEFYGLHRETIVKTINSEIPYTIGDVVRSCYVDKKDFLLFDEEKPIVKVHSRASTILVIIVLLLSGFSVLGMIITKNEELREVLSYVVGYGVSILFAGFGICKIIDYKKWGRLKDEFEVMTGTQVSYEKERNSNEDRNDYIYYSIYEYTMNGKSCLFRSSLGTSRKPKETGHQVHLERNKLTGEIKCREDEKSALVIYFFMMLIGMLFLGLMTNYIICNGNL